MPNEPEDVYFTPVVIRYSLEPQELKLRHTLYRFRFEWQLNEAQNRSTAAPPAKIGEYLKLCRELNSDPTVPEGSRSIFNVTA